MLFIQIDITYLCNASCPQCDRACKIAPSDFLMSLEQIDKFINDTKEANLNWDRISILGGEPSLHPQLNSIINKLIEVNTKEIQICTNGLKPFSIDSMNHEKVTVRVSPPAIKKHFAVYRAPIDITLKEHPYGNGCPIIDDCGLGYNGLYYPCGCGGAIDRVFNLNCGHDSLKTYTNEVLTAQCEKLCKLCGHFMEFRTGFGGRTQTFDDRMSQSWEEAIDNGLYKKSKK